MPADPTAALQALMACDVPGLDVAGVVDAAHRSRIVRGWLDAFDAALSARSDQLHASGQGLPAEELHSRRAACRRLRAAAAAAARRSWRRRPRWPTRLAAGEVGAEHADVIADLTSKLEPEIAESFFSHQATLADDAKFESPELFGRRCRNLLSRIEAQAGIDRDQRQRRQTRLSRRIDANGMHHL